MFLPGKSLQAIETRTAGKEMRVIPFKLFIGYLKEKERRKNSEVTEKPKGEFIRVY